MTINRFRGCLLGLAAGDAVGTTLEFKHPGTFKPIDDMVGGGPFYLKAGQWTDDTSMALCLAESLIECDEFNPADQLRRYVRWARHGHLSSTGSCFDIGMTVAAALERFESSPAEYCGDTDPQTAGNGSIMRLAPVPMFFANTPEEAIRRSGDSSRTTHAAREAVDACRYLGGLIVGALQGVAKEDLLSLFYSPVANFWTGHNSLAPKVAAIAGGSFKHKNPPALRGTGYVVASLEAALWAFYSTDSYKAGCLKAANLGDDADTTAAVYGQLAGAYYGEGGIPADWRSKLALHDTIREFADRLYAHGA